MLGSGPLTLILNMQSGANDISIDVLDSDLSPRIVFTGSETTFCQDYAQLQPTPETGEETEPTDEQNPDNAIPPTDQANIGSEDGGSGSTGLTILCALFSVLVLRRRSRLV